MNTADANNSQLWEKKPENLKQLNLTSFPPIFYSQNENKKT